MGGARLAPIDDDDDAPDPRGYDRIDAALEAYYALVLRHERIDRAWFRRNFPLLTADEMAYLMKNEPWVPRRVE